VLRYVLCLVAPDLNGSPILFQIQADPVAPEELMIAAAG
jgi:hypothetical protein